MPLDATDPECPNGFFCTPDAKGWLGPVVVWEGSASGAVPACPSGYPDAAFSLSKGQITDEPCLCTCSQLGSGCPDLLQVDLYEDESCAGTPCDTQDVGPTCFYLAGACSTIGSAKLRPSTYDKCSEGGASVPPQRFKQRVEACSPSLGQGCTGGTCLTTPVAPYAKLCIYNDGEHPCPANSPYSLRELYYAAATDTRSCADAACGCAPEGSCGTLELHPDSGCVAKGDVHPVVPTGSSCTKTPRGASWTKAASLQCLPHLFPLPTGAVTGSGPVTACCKPW